MLLDIKFGTLFRKYFTNNIKCIQSKHVILMYKYGTYVHKIYITIASRSGDAIDVIYDYFPGVSGSRSSPSQDGSQTFRVLYLA